MNHRQQFEKRMTEAAEKKQADVHIHTWKTFKKTLKIDNNNFNGTNAYFVLQGCTSCHEKRYVDYRIER